MKTLTPKFTLTTIHTKQFTDIKPTETNSAEFISAKFKDIIQLNCILITKLLIPLPTLFIEKKPSRKDYSSLSLYTEFT